MDQKRNIFYQAIIIASTFFMAFIISFMICGIIVYGNSDEEMIIVDETEPITENTVNKQKEKSNGLLSDIDNLFEEIDGSSLVINKQLIGGVWHVGCDVMGNQAWVKDEISNPKGIKSREGHRLAYCGDPSHWIIYLNKYGIPFQMIEIKSGSTGGTLNTKFYTDATYTTEKDIRTINLGERIYWTTWNKDQVWHHTGITTPEIPSFEFVVNGISYNIPPGETQAIMNLPAGEYKIIEKYDPNYFIADVSIPYYLDESSNVIVNVTLKDNEQAIVNFINQRIEPDDPNETELITEPITETETETEQPTEIQTEPPVVITESETEALTETESELITETESEVLTETESEADTETETELIVETESELTTETELEISTETEFQSETETEQTSETESETETEVITEKQTETPTEKPTEKQTEKQTEAPKVSGAVLGASREREDQNNNGNNNKKGVQGVSRDRVAVPQTESLIQKSTEGVIPKTGDVTPIEKWIAIIFVAAIVMIVLLYAIRNRRY